MSDDGTTAPSVASLVVVAHPDDETLWLEPWLSADTQIVVAFPDHPVDPAVSAARVGLATGYPHGTMTLLPLHSLDVLGRSDRRRRSPNRYGVELGRDCPAAVRQEYADNHERLCELLDPIMAAHPTVWTHNPWGEYGHEEHVQVCRAVLDVGARHGSSVWAWDGLSVRELAQTSMRLRVDYFEPRVGDLRSVGRSLDRGRYRALKRMYDDAGAWTWDDDYEPPATMNFIELMCDGRELLPPIPPSRVARSLGIVAGHMRRVPTVSRRVIRERRFRGS